MVQNDGAIGCGDTTRTANNPQCGGNAWECNDEDDEDKLGTSYGMWCMWNERSAPSKRANGEATSPWWSVACEQLVHGDCSRKGNGGTGGGGKRRRRRNGGSEY